jgi:hypothetical protein
MTLFSELFLDTMFKDYQILLFQLLLEQRASINQRSNEELIEKKITNIICRIFGNVIKDLELHHLTIRYRVSEEIIYIWDEFNKMLNEMNHHHNNLIGKIGLTITIFCSSK